MKRRIFLPLIIAASLMLTLFSAGCDTDSGSVPVDAGNYIEGSTVTVLGNTGNPAL